HDRCCRFFFFFSSRRRHTRSKRDWSSDVCSSDLGPTAAAAAPPSRAGRDLTRAIPVGVGLGALVIASIAFSPRWWYLVAAGAVRSEERRVGKECRRGRRAGQKEREERWRKRESRR